MYRSQLMTASLAMAALDVWAGFVADAPCPVGADLRLLRSLIDQRLALMPAVARFTWHNGYEIDDPSREKEIIRRFALRAQKVGLPDDWARTFMDAQIEAGKMVQCECFGRWRGVGVVPGAQGAGRASEIRMRVDAIDSALARAIAKAWPTLCAPEKQEEVRAAMSALESAYLSSRAAGLAVAMLVDGSLSAVNVAEETALECAMV